MHAKKYRRWDGTHCVGRKTVVGGTRCCELELELAVVVAVELGRIPKDGGKEDSPLDYLHRWDGTLFLIWTVDGRNSSPYDKHYGVFFCYYRLWFATATAAVVGRRLTIDD